MCRTKLNDIIVPGEMEIDVQIMPKMTCDTGLDALFAAGGASTVPAVMWSRKENAHARVLPGTSTPFFSPSRFPLDPVLRSSTPISFTDTARLAAPIDPHLAVLEPLVANLLTAQAAA